MDNKRVKEICLSFAVLLISSIVAVWICNQAYLLVYTNFNPFTAYVASLIPGMAYFYLTVRMMRRLNQALVKDS